METRQILGTSFVDLQGQEFSHLKLKFSIRETIPTSETPSISVEYLLAWAR